MIRTTKAPERAEIKHVRTSTPPRAELHCSRSLDPRPCAPSPEARR